MDNVTCISRSPFEIGSPDVRTYRPGVTISEILAMTDGLPADMERSGVVRVGDTLYPPVTWPYVKPKPGATVAVQTRLRGGGGGDDKGASVFATIAAIGLAVFSAGIAAGSAQALLGSAFAKGTIGAYALAATTSIVGSFLLQSLLPPPSSLTRQSASAQQRREDLGAASADANLLDPNGPIPRVIGTRKIYPPFAMPPRFEYDDQDEFVEAIFTLAGPHDLSNIRVDDVPIAEAEDIIFETREGWQDDTPIAIVTKQAQIIGDQIELSSYQTNPDDYTKVKFISTDTQPFYHALGSGYAPDRLNVHMMAPQGLSNSASTTTFVRVPFRFRMRTVGSSTWIYLPELHYVDASIQQRRFEFVFEFVDTLPTGFPAIPASSGFLEARRTADSYVANSYFYSGSGDEYLTNANAGTSGVQNVGLEQTRATFYLDKSVFTAAEYEIEMIRGAILLDSKYVASAYTYDSSVIDLFGQDNGDIPESRDKMVDTIYVARAIATWDEHPVQSPGFALIAVRAKNRPIRRLSVEASGYVQDWGGSAWDTWTTTSNPAPHFRDVLVGSLNLDPVPIGIIDDSSLTTWRSRCVTAGYTCDYIAEGDRVDDLLRIIAGTGYARPYQSETWGVIEDYDRSAESPVQVFSSRNSRDFFFRKAFARLPDGLRVNYPKNVGDGTRDQITVRRGTDGGERFEQITYEGMIDEGRVVDRANYDLGQVTKRATTYGLIAPAEAVVCRKGSLVLVETDVIRRRSRAARVTAVNITGPNIVSLDVDAIIDVKNTTEILSVTDMLAEADVLDLGLETGFSIRRSDNTISTHQISNATGASQTISLTVPVTASGSNIEVGNLVVIGDLGIEARRMLVSDIEPQEELTFQLSLVDEASELWA